MIFIAVIDQCIPIIFVRNMDLEGLELEKKNKKIDAVLASPHN